jgi:hypothetical protein
MINVGHKMPRLARPSYHHRYVLIVSISILLACIITEIQGYSKRSNFPSHSVSLSKKWTLTNNGPSRTRLSETISVNQVSIDIFKKQLIDSIKHINDGSSTPYSIPPSQDDDTMTVKDLYKKWVELQKSGKLPTSDSKLIPLNDLLPFIWTDVESRDIELLDDGAAVKGVLPGYDDKEYNEPVFVTENELVRLWNEGSVKAFGKGMDKFDVQEALLLLDDRTDEYIMADDTVYDEIAVYSKADIKEDKLAQTSKKISKKSQISEDSAITSIEGVVTPLSDLISVKTVIEEVASRDEPELFITDQVRLRDTICIYNIQYVGLDV